MTIQSLLKKGAAFACHRAGLHRWMHRGRAVILMYHRILTEEERIRRFVQPGMYVTPSVFEEQVAFLKAHYTLVSLSHLLSCWRQGRLPDIQQYAVITFDDGWRDNYQNAYPILRRYQAPATIFLPTAYIGTNRWFWTDRLAALIGPCGKMDRTQYEAIGRLLAPFHISWPPYRGDRSVLLDEMDAIIESLKAVPSEAVEALIGRLCAVLDRPDPSESGERPFLNWEEVAEMSQQGISFGAHSHSHRILTALPPDAVWEELTTSLRTLQERAVQALPVFCYPNGNATDQIRGWVKEAGYQAAIGGGGVEGTVPSDLFNLRRIGIHNDVSATLPLFSFRMLDFRWRRS
jgi:peptidoglycan/xylan/chitin deacetylase (PgdA/CDA1 family)